MLGNQARSDKRREVHLPDLDSVGVGQTGDSIADRVRRWPLSGSSHARLQVVNIVRSLPSVRVARVEHAEILVALVHASVNEWQEVEILQVTEGEGVLTTECGIVVRGGLVGGIHDREEGLELDVWRKLHRLG